MLYGRDEPRRAGLGGEQVIGVHGRLTRMTPIPVLDGDLADGGSTWTR